MIKKRLQDLEELVARRGRGRCPGTPAIVLPHNGRGPLPPAVPPCRWCGRVHGLVIEAPADDATSHGGATSAVGASDQYPPVCG
jgi:hypothetical protein